LPKTGKQEKRGSEKNKTMEKAKKLLKQFYKELQQWGAAAAWAIRQ
jgi:hypothetical protein